MGETGLHSQACCHERFDASSHPKGVPCRCFETCTSLAYKRVLHLTHWIIREHRSRCTIDTPCRSKRRCSSTRRASSAWASSLWAPRALASRRSGRCSLLRAHTSAPRRASTRSIRRRSRASSSSAASTPRHGAVFGMLYRCLHCLLCLHTQFESAAAIAPPRQPRRRHAVHCSSCCTTAVWYFGCSAGVLCGRRSAFMRVAKLCVVLTHQKDELDERLFVKRRF